MTYINTLNKAKDLAARDRGYKNWNDISESFKDASNPNYISAIQLECMSDVAHFYSMLEMIEFRLSLRSYVNNIINDITQTRMFESQDIELIQNIVEKYILEPKEYQPNYPEPYTKQISTLKNIVYEQMEQLIPDGQEIFFNLKIPNIIIEAERRECTIIGVEDNKRMGRVVKYVYDSYGYDHFGQIPFEKLSLEILCMVVDKLKNNE